MTAQPVPQPSAQPIGRLDDDVNAYLNLTEQIEQLTSQRDAIKARLAQRGVGDHTTSTGTVVSVTEPNRRFNLEKALGMLTEEQQTLCLSPDPAKVKKQLPPVLTESCMEPGTGALRVAVK